MLPIVPIYIYPPHPRWVCSSGFKKNIFPFEELAIELPLELERTRNSGSMQKKRKQVNVFGWTLPWNSAVTPSQSRG